MEGGTNDKKQADLLVVEGGLLDAQQQRVDVVALRPLEVLEQLGTHLIVEKGIIKKRIFKMFLCSKKSWREGLRGRMALDQGMLTVD